MTRLELQTLDLVRERLTVAGFAPSVREIAAATGRGVQTIHGALSRLVAGGHLIREPRRPRGLRLPETADLCAVPTEAMRAELARRGESLDALDDAPRTRFGWRGASCAADCCQVEVKRGMLFCRRHWFALPVSLQRDIKRAFGARNEALYRLYVNEARNRIDRGADVTDPRPAS